MTQRHQRTLPQMLAFAVAKAFAVTAALLAGHVVLSIAADPYGVSAPTPQPPTTTVVTVEQPVEQQPGH